MRTDIFCNGLNRLTITVSDLSDDDDSLVTVQIGDRNGGLTVFLDTEQARDLADKIYDAQRAHDVKAVASA